MIENRQLQTHWINLLTSLFYSAISDKTAKSLSRKNLPKHFNDSNVCHTRVILLVGGSRRVCGSQTLGGSTVRSSMYSSMPVIKSWAVLALYATSQNICILCDTHRSNHTRIITGFTAVISFIQPMVSISKCPLQTLSTTVFLCLK